MAYTKVMQIKKNTHLKSSLKYILNPNKTENLTYANAYYCSLNNPEIYFEEVAKQAKFKKGNNLAHHIVQSFAPEDNITPEKAMEIGQELMNRLYPDFQYVIAVHTDGECIHNHIVLNAVDFKTFHKFKNNKKAWRDISRVSDELCKENNLSVIQGDNISRREVTKKAIDKAIAKSSDFEDFLNLLKKQSFEIKYDDYFYVKGPTDERFRRTDTLGDAYTLIGIKRRIGNIEIDRSQRKKIYGNKFKRTSNRRRLSQEIKYLMKEAESFEDLFKKLQAEGIEVKQGKYISLKPVNAKRFIRLKSLGEEYSENMLRLYFEDKALYNCRCKEIQRDRIGYIDNDPKKAYNKYTASHNLDVSIRVMNYLSQNNIKSIEEFTQKHDKLKKQLANIQEDIKFQTVSFDSKREIIKAIRNYWDLKPIKSKYDVIKDDGERKAFHNAHEEELTRFSTTVDIIKHHKKSNGELPTADEINDDVNYEQEKLEDLKNMAEEIKKELQKMDVIEENLKRMEIMPEEEKEREKVHGRNYNYER